MRLVRAGASVAVGKLLMAAQAVAAPSTVESVVAPPTDAPAAPSPSAPAKPNSAAPLSRIGLDLAFHTHSQRIETITVVAPVVQAVLWVGRFTLEPELPVVYYHVHYSLTSPESGFGLGNPSFAAKYHYRTDALDFYAGCGVAFPVAQYTTRDSGDQRKATGYLTAIGTRGGWNVWWYAPDSLTFYLPIGVRYVFPMGLDVGVDAAAALGLLLDRGVEPYGAAQIGAHVGFASPWIDTGLRVRIAGWGNPQTSLEPYVEGFFGNAYVGAGVLFHVGDPVDPFQYAGSIWGLRIAGGARF